MAAEKSRYQPALQARLQGRNAVIKLPGMIRRLLPGMFIILSLVFSPAAYGRNANPEDAAIEQYIVNGGYMVKPLHGQSEGLNVDTPFVPASTIKLVTSLAALHFLGPDYRFATRFSTDSDNNLYIRGDGDPTLTSEDVAKIAGELFEQGIRRVNAVILDDSAFALEGPADGSENSARPYDAGITPLSINFNALPILVRVDKSMGSGEQQTPLLPIMREIGKNLAPGQYRVNVGAYPVRGNLSNEQRYAAEMFITLLRQQGIQVGGAVFAGTVPDNAHLIFTHKSDPLSDIIRSCLKYSNNFIANDLFIACGRARFGGAGTWNKGRLALDEFTAATLGLGPGAITMVEGAGLSRKNQISPRTMISVLEAFAPHVDLMTEKHDFLMKSGTMKGVYCYGGYFADPGGDRLVPFVIMLNQENNTRDKILRLLAARFEPQGASAAGGVAEGR